MQNNFTLVFSHAKEKGRKTNKTYICGAFPSILNSKSNSICVADYYYYYYYQMIYYHHYYIFPIKILHFAKAQSLRN
jgi:hypothetical protein